MARGVNSLRRGMVAAATGGWRVGWLIANLTAGPQSERHANCTSASRPRIAAQTVAPDWSPDARVW